MSIARTLSRVPLDNYKMQILVPHFEACIQFNIDLGRLDFLLDFNLNLQLTTCCRCSSWPQDTFIPMHIITAT